MNPGLEKGFVKFNTIAHVVLRTLLAGDSGFVELRRELQDGPLRFNDLSAALSLSLRRLEQSGFIYRIGHERNHTARQTGVYSLNQPRKAVPQFKPLTTAERSRRSRAKRAVVVSSVFEFRGRISVKQDCI